MLKWSVSQFSSDDVGCNPARMRKMSHEGSMTHPTVEVTQLRIRRALDKISLVTKLNDVIRFEES